jgi:hypothetical protein
MKHPVDIISLALNPRAFNTQKIMDLAEISGFIDVKPTETKLGVVDTITSFGELVNSDSGDWHILGSLDDLTTEEFNSVFTSVQDFCQRVMQSAANK